jgi:PAS domain S-box-containing protein
MLYKSPRYEGTRADSAQGKIQDNTEAFPPRPAAIDGPTPTQRGMIGHPGTSSAPACMTETAVFEAMPDPVAGCERDGTIVYVNPAACRALARSPEQLMGTRFWALHAEPEREAFAAAFARTAGTGRAVQLECAWPTNRWFAHQICLAGGKLWVCSRDITEHRRAAERLKVIGDSLPVLVSLLDRSERYLFVNATYQHWFGEEPSAILGRQLAEVVGPAVYESIAPHVKAVLAGKPVSFQTRALYRNGGPREIEASYTPYLLDGEVAGFVALVVDVSERVQMQESLKAAVAVRDEFLSMASHELRTPLAALQLLLDGVQRALVKPPASLDREKLHRRLKMSDRQVSRLATLIDGLLDVSRLGMGGAFRLEPRPLDLVDLVREVVDRFHEEARRIGSPIVMDAPPSVTGSWDRNRLDQAFTNLLSNALKYGPGEPIAVTVTADAERATLSIRDGGIGIASEDRERIFGRFERAVPSSHYGGMGLGLYVTGRIVHAHGGTIQVDSEPGQGATFTITLPRRTSGVDPTGDPPGQWWP